MNGGGSGWLVSGCGRIVDISGRLNSGQRRVSAAVKIGEARKWRAASWVRGWHGSADEVAGTCGGGGRAMSGVSRQAVDLGGRWRRGCGCDGRKAAAGERVRRGVGGFERRAIMILVGTRRATERQAAMSLGGGTDRRGEEVSVWLRFGCNGREVAADEYRVRV